MSGLNEITITLDYQNPVLVEYCKDQLEIFSIQGIDTECFQESYHDKVAQELNAVLASNRQDSIDCMADFEYSQSKEEG